MQLQVVQGRQCGPCTQCCTTMGVRELRKQAHTPCTHCSSGCDIYPDRPKSCIDFRCLWLDGNLTDHGARPDLSGIVWALMPNEIQRKGMWTAYEAKPGAFRFPDNVRMIENIRQREVVLLVAIEGPRRFIGPDYKMGKVMRMASETALRAGRPDAVRFSGVAPRNRR